MVGESRDHRAGRRRHGLGASFYTPVGWFNTIMSFPRAIGWLAMFMLYSTGLNQWIGITFLAIFPRRLFQLRWIWVIIWLPALVVIPVTTVVYPNPMHSFSRWWPDWYDGLWRLIVIAATAALPLVAILNYLNLRNPAERRRLRMVVVGLAVSAIVAIAFLARLILIPLEPVRRLVAGAPGDGVDAFRVPVRSRSGDEAHDRDVQS